MASSNIKLFDENKGNMLSDSEFSISNQRMNGLQTGVASSQLQNKAMYQASLVAYAIAQVMMQNGKNANDTDAVSAFVANLSGTMLQKVYDLATTAEAQAGVATGKWMSPALVKAAIDTLAAKAQNILSNETKALYGLGADAVPDDAFHLIANMRAVIHVFTTANASVSMTKGEKTFTIVADSEGLADLYPSEFGSWTVTAGSISKTINIDAIAEFYMLMSSVESLSWSRVAAFSKMGLARSMFHIGDEKTLTVNGVSYTAVIIGFDHDTPVNTATYGRDKAGITWQLKNCLNDKYQMNSTNTNKGGWTSCAMRTSTLATMLSQLESDLKNAIVKVKKLSSAGDKSNAINTTEDSLFLLSEVEIFGSTVHAKAGEGSQYEYYQSGNSRVKTVDGSASLWWERSPYGGNSATFCYVNTNGLASWDSYANYSYGVSFAFCV